MYLGTYLVNITPGKRLAVPSSFRKTLGEKMILAKWYEDCLVLVGRSYWDALLERLTGGEKMAIIPVRQTERFIFASAYELEADEQGRIIVPDRLLNYASLGEQVYFLGVNDRIEIWDKRTWDDKEKEVAREAPSFVEKLAHGNS